MNVHKNDCQLFPNSEKFNILWCTIYHGNRQVDPFSVVLEHFFMFWLCCKTDFLWGILNHHRNTTGCYCMQMQFKHLCRSWIMYSSDIHYTPFLFPKAAFLIKIILSFLPKKYLNSALFVFIIIWFYQTLIVSKTYFKCLKTDFPTMNFIFFLFKIHALYFQ